MNLEPEIAAFVGGPVLISLGTRDARDRPMIGRASGGWVAPDGERVTIAISAFLWPETVENLGANAMLAATFVRPDDYRAFQLKGRAQLRPPTEADRDASAAYVAAARATLAALGVPVPMIDVWLTDRDLVIAELAVDRVFEQTPGPRAGRAVQ